MKKNDSVNMNAVCQDRTQLRAIVFGMIRNKAAKKETPGWPVFSLTPAWKNLAPEMTLENQVRFELEWRYIYKLPFVTKSEKFIAILKDFADNANLLAYASAFYTWAQLFYDESGDGVIIAAPAIETSGMKGVVIPKQRFHPDTRPRGAHYLINAPESEQFVERVIVEMLDEERKEYRQVEVLQRMDKRDEPKIIMSRSLFPLKNNKGEVFDTPDIDVQNVILAIRLGVLPFTLVQYVADKKIIQDVNNYSVAGTLIGSRGDGTVYQRGPNGNLINMTKKKGIRHETDPDKPKEQEKVMAEKTIAETVKDIIVEQLGVNSAQVVPDAKFIEDLGADSLDTVELVMAFEEEYNFEVPDEDAEKIETVADVIAYIESKVKKG